MPAETEGTGFTSVTNRLTFAEMQARQAEAAAEAKDVSVKVEGLIAFDPDEAQFQLLADLSKLQETDINWKETVVVRAGKASKSLKGMISIRATMPADATVTVLCPQLDKMGIQLFEADGTTPLPKVARTYRVKPSMAYGADRYIHFSVEPA